MKRGEHTPEATKRRKQQQRKYRRYMELRDELQTAGVIPVEPSGAKRSECVDPTTQGSQSLPSLVGQAIRQGWAVPEAKKPELVTEMLDVVNDPEESSKVKVAAFNALRMADKDQWERDHPDEGTKAQGPTVLNINLVNVDAVPNPQEDRRSIEGILVEVVPSGDDGVPEDHQGLPQAAPVPRE